MEKLKQALHRFKIKLIWSIREFLWINRDKAAIDADIKAIMEKELERDLQYPLEDREAVSLD